MQEQNTTIQKATPVLSVRPHFDQGLTMVHAGMLTVLAAILIPILGGTFLYLLITLLGLGKFIAVSYVYGLLFVGSIAVVPPLFFELRKKAYERTAFHFYHDHLDFQYFKFYLGRRRGRVRYADIRDVSQRASALQEQRNLTTIQLYVPSMEYQQRRDFPGISMTDLQQRADYMPRIMQIIENGVRNPMPAPSASPVMAATAEPGNNLLPR